MPSFSDLVGQTISETAGVLRARYNDRAADVPGVRDTGLDSVSASQNVQARPGTGGAVSTGINPLWIGLGVAAVAILIFLARK